MAATAYASEAVLRDGAPVLIHSVAPTDGAQVELAAVTTQLGHEQILGVARYAVVPGTRPGVAEVSFDVGEADRARGIGTLLLEHLARIARAQDIAVLRADGEDGRVELPLAETERFLAASADRERRAAAHSLEAIFAPRSIAVIGASRTQGTIGRAILDNLLRDGFRGAIYPVNPNVTDLAGRRAFPSVGAIGKPVDLAVIAVPAAAVERVIRECGAAGVRAVDVISAGFAEAGGREQERRLRGLVREAGMRMVGPNCMGVLSTDPRVCMNATFSPVFPPAGCVSMVSQSGALGLAMLDHARELELGIADFVSIGNRADVSINDVLAYWHDQPRTRVIALYLESFGNPRTFARLAPEVARARPIVAVKSGRTAAGTRAASSHSAALASMDIGIDALFAQTGVIRVDTLEQMFDLVALFSSQPVPAGPRVGVVTNAGGPGILLADACEAHGLVLPRLAEATRKALAALLPPHAGLANPIDMIASAPPAHYEAAIRLVGNDPNVDSVVAVYVPPLVTAPEEVAAAIARGAATIPRDKPIATVFLSSKGTPGLLSRGERGPIPSYAFPENAALALAAATRYGAWRSRPRGEQSRLSAALEQEVRHWVRERRPVGWLPFDELVDLLRLIGVAVAPHRTVPPDGGAAVAAAHELGYPVVVKAVAPGLVHKTEAGGVAVGLGDDAAVERAVATMQARIAGLERVIVQRQVAARVEAIVGATTDPSLGTLLVAGIGGTAVELYKDVAFRVTPVTDRDAAEMIDQLRGRALLDGFRGGPPADRAALIDVVLRIGALLEVLPEILELDLNPVMVLEPGAGAIVVDARMLLRRS